MTRMINLIIDQEPNSLNQLYDGVDQRERVFSAVSWLCSAHACNPCHQWLSAHN
jgi:hypothetical protein